MIIEFKLPLRSYYEDEVIHKSIYYECNNMPLIEDVIKHEKNKHERNINSLNYNKKEGEDIIHSLETMNQYKNLDKDGLKEYSFLSEVVGIGMVLGWVKIVEINKI